jgi:hypothetical protein
MTEESTPSSPQDPSDSAEEILAQAKLKEAEAALITAKTPLWDRVMIRGVLPIALAIVGPWAAMTFSESQIEQRKQGQHIEALEELLQQARSDAEDRRRELMTMSNMVTRLDATLKTALIQMTVARIVKEEEEEAKPVALTRMDVGRDVAAQVSLPGLEEEEVRQIAEQQYDRMMEAKRK